MQLCLPLSGTVARPNKPLSLEATNCQPPPFARQKTKNITYLGVAGKFLSVLGLIFDVSGHLHLAT
jgi:hypothetical protein